MHFKLGSWWSASPELNTSSEKKKRPKGAPFGLHDRYGSSSWSYMVMGCTNPYLSRKTSQSYYVFWPHRSIHHFLMDQCSTQLRITGVQRAPRKITQSASFLSIASGEGTGLHSRSSAFDSPVDARGSVMGSSGKTSCTTSKSREIAATWGMGNFAISTESKYAKDVWCVASNVFLYEPSSAVQ